MSSRKIYGIISTDNGRYVMASLKKSGPAWRLSRGSSWNSSNRWQAAMLMNAGIVLGLPASWRSSATLPGSDGLATTETRQAINPVLHTAHIAAHQKHLGANTIAVLPDDAFLSAIPLVIANNCPGSFLSIYDAGNQVKIGVTIQKKLFSVFTFKSNNSQAIESHLGRVIRYVGRLVADADMPLKAYFINLPVPINLDRLDGEALQPGGLGIGQNDRDMLKAAGAALAHDLKSAPEFAIDTSPAQFRHIRACIYATAFIAIVLSILSIAGLFMGEAYISRQLKKNKAAYESVLHQNKDLQILLSENDSLATRAHLVSGRLSRRTGWSMVLNDLGRLCPEGLSISRFGSEPAVSNNTQVRIALNGIADSQILVTKFISALQKRQGISSVSLSSMEQNETGKKSTFTILCQVNFSKL